MAPKGETLTGAGQAQRRATPAARLYSVAVLKAVFSAISAVCSVPAGGLDATVRAITTPNTWMTTSVPYWEGPVSIISNHSGTGYLEMSGCDG